MSAPGSISELDARNRHNHDAAADGFELRSAGANDPASADFGDDQLFIDVPASSELPAPNRQRSQGHLDQSSSPAEKVAHCGFSALGIPFRFGLTLAIIKNGGKMMNIKTDFENQHRQTVFLP